MRFIRYKECVRSCSPKPLPEASAAPTALAGLALISLISCAAVNKDIAKHPPLVSKPQVSQTDSRGVCKTSLTVPWQDGRLLIERKRFIYEDKGASGVIDFGFPLFPEFGCPQQAVGRPDFTAVLTETHLVLTSGSETALQKISLGQQVSEAFSFRALELASYPQNSTHKLIAFTSNRELEGFLLYRSEDGRGILTVRGANGGQEHYMQPLPEDFLFSSKAVLVHHSGALYIFSPGRAEFIKVKGVAGGKPGVYYVSNRSALPEEVKKEME